MYDTRHQLSIQHKLFLNVAEQSLQYKHHMFALTMLHIQFVMSAGYQEVTVKIKRTSVPSISPSGYLDTA